MAKIFILYLDSYAADTKSKAIGFLKEELINNNRIKHATNVHHLQHNAIDLHELQMMKIDEIIDKLNTTTPASANNDI